MSGIDLSLDDLIKKSRGERFKRQNHQNEQNNFYQSNNMHNSYGQNNNLKRRKHVFKKRKFTNDNNNIFDTKKEEIKTNNFGTNLYTRTRKFKDKFEEKKQNKRTLHSSRRSPPEKHKSIEQSKRVNEDINQDSLNSSYSVNEEFSKTKLFISNLQKDITNSELYQLFSEVGQLKRCGIHWDILGKSLGTADIEYFTPEHSQKAIEEFNNAEIEGVSLKIEFARNSRSKDISEKIKRIRFGLKSNKNTKN